MNATLEECVIGIDAYGGDKTEEGSACKRVTVAIKEIAPNYPRQQFVLAGEEEVIRKYLGKWFVPKNIHVIDINKGKKKEPTADDEPTKTQLLRTLGTLTKLVKETGNNHVDGLYSLGNTKLVTLAVSKDIGLMEEYKQFFPGEELVPLLAEVPKAPKVYRAESYYLIDAGSIPELTKPEQFVVYAHLGMIYARAVGKRPNPVVALSNIGKEKDKGSSLLKDAHKLLEEKLSGVFMGNVEPFSSSYEHEKGAESESMPSDVVLASGNMGNELIKALATGAHLFGDIFKDELNKSGPHKKLAAWLLKDVFGAAKQRLARYGGAVYIGSNNPASKEHGSANIETIMHGPPKLATYITSNATEKMRSALAMQKPALN